ncbi:endopeptidase La [Bacteroidota bacterium]
MDESKIPDSIPLLPLRNTVLFPGVIIPITIGREKSIKLIKDIYKKDKIIGAISQKDKSIEDPKTKDLNETGTIAQIVKVLQMPDDSTSVIIQGQKRFKINDFVSEDPYFQANISVLEDKIPKSGNKEFEALVSSLKDLSIKIIQYSSNIPPEASFAVKNIENPSFLINFICSNSDIDFKEKQSLLEEDNLRKRGERLLKLLTQEIQKLELKKEIQSKVKSELEQQQKEFLLNQQMKTIQDELGGSPIEKEIREFNQRAKTKKWPKEVNETFLKELDKLKRVNPASAEYSVQLNYIQVLLDLPWNAYSEDSFNLKRATKILDEDHFGLEIVKDRIIEYLAVLKLKGDMKSPIICLYGPPGVGKTSLGKSVARALKRKYVRMSLGGLKDESEIRGHRKTYIGAMPGRIIQSIKRAKTSNPVFILDEIDKVGSDFHGDPSSALLEVLDPEQNSTFYDNYLELEYDLSKVMFIATANITSTINPALLDRMELIDVSGYIVEEKIEIAKRHLIKKQLEAHGIKPNQIKFPKETIEYIIENHTRESGVRLLDKKIANVTRAIAKKIALEEKIERVIEKKTIVDILGPPEVIKDKYQGNEIAGVVVGLAWTASGGTILFVETSLSKGKGKLTITGNLGDVMKESAVIALEYLKAHAGYLKINEEVFDKWNVHIHVPEGAIPKDGPSAGITMLTSLASAFTQRRVKKNVAMTGEITLRGKVLPVGGIKEKILAAKRANIKELIICRENQKDINKIKDLYVKGLKFSYADTMMNVLDLALSKKKVDNPVNIN